MKNNNKDCKHDHPIQKMAMLDSQRHPQKLCLIKFELYLNVYTFEIIRIKNFLEIEIFNIIDQGYRCESGIAIFACRVNRK